MTTGRIVAVLTGRPREVSWQGQVLRTSIFRTPRSGRVAVGAEGLEGDEVGNPSVHGGPRKRVNAYPSEHYPAWSEELGAGALPWGSFGENLTTEGLLETDLRPGDVLVVGELRLAVTQPRMPCVKLNARFGRPDVIERFLRAERSGFYLSVEHAGSVAPGDTVHVEAGGGAGPTLREMFRAKARETG